MYSRQMLKNKIDFKLILNGLRSLQTTLAKWSPSLYTVGVVHLTCPGRRDSRAPDVVIGLSVCGVGMALGLA